MTKQESLKACEGFRTAVMLSIDSMEIDSETKSLLLISLQTFYLEMLRKTSAELVHPEIIN